MRRAVLFAAVALSALTLSAACTEAATSPADGSGTGPAGRPGTPATGAPSAGAKAGGPGSGRGAPTGEEDQLAGRGDRADWQKLVTACPDSGQRVIVQKVVTADVTGDGTYDALVARSCSVRSSYWPSTVEVFDGASPSTAPRRVSILLKDVGAADRPWLTSLRVTGSIVTVAANGVGRTGAQSCPDQSLTYRYTVLGGAVQRTAREVRTARDCLPVG